MNLADQFEAVLQYLIDNKPADIDTIAAATNLGYQKVNSLLCELRLKGRVAHEVARVKGKGKVNLYSIKAK